MAGWIATAPHKRLANALVALYHRQTADEQAAGDTRHNNGVGFTGHDAPVLTSIAQWYMDKGFVTPKQGELIRKKIKKYAGQLARIAADMTA